MTSPHDIYRDQPTDEEIEDVLAQRLSGVVGTLNEDGSIHLAYVIFLWESGRLWYETSSVTRKARNVAARPTSSFIVQGTAASGRGLMVALEGTVEILTGAEARGVQHRIRAKYVRAEVLPALDRAWDEMDDVAIGIIPVRRRSWTGGTLAAFTEAALGSPYDDAWIAD
jgi:hypothetical protein